MNHTNLQNADKDQYNYKLTVAELIQSELNFLLQMSFMYRALHDHEQIKKLREKFHTNALEKSIKSHLELIAIQLVPILKNTFSNQTIIDIESIWTEIKNNLLPLPTKMSEQQIEYCKNPQSKLSIATMTQDILLYDIQKNDNLHDILYVISTKNFDESFFKLCYEANIAANRLDILLNRDKIDRNTPADYRVFYAYNLNNNLNFILPIIRMSKYPLLAQALQASAQKNIVKERQKFAQSIGMPWLNNPIKAMYAIFIQKNPLHYIEKYKNSRQYFCNEFNNTAQILSELQSIFYRYRNLNKKFFLEKIKRCFDVNRKIYADESSIRAMAIPEAVRLCFKEIAKNKKNYITNGVKKDLIDYFDKLHIDIPKDIRTKLEEMLPVDKQISILEAQINALQQQIDKLKKSVPPHTTSKNSGIKKIMQNAKLLLKKKNPIPITKNHLKDRTKSPKRQNSKHDF